MLTELHMKVLLAKMECLKDKVFQLIQANIRSWDNLKTVNRYKAYRPLMMAVCLKAGLRILSTLASEEQYSR